MKATVEDKLDRIADIWNYFIWDNKFCSRRIKFDEDVKANYFGDMLGYFKDTLDIIFTTNKHYSHTDKFSFTISFLQAIYVQQDLMQAMLEIFKTKIDKGNLKNDPVYCINRDIRNELVGHPIRKVNVPTGEFVTKKCDSCSTILSTPKNKLALLSSTFFSYQSSEDEIQYVLYHKDNNFKFEIKAFKIADIQEKHREFLEKYFDIILSKLKSILEEYLLMLNRLEEVIEARTFDIVLELIELYLEEVFKHYPVYDKASLLKIYDRRHEHLRYQNYIDKFCYDLRAALAEKRNLIKDIFQREIINKSSREYSSLKDINTVFARLGSANEDKEPRKKTYKYELEKIAEKRNAKDFGFFSGMLKAKCKDNSLVLRELEHMEKNIYNEIEYYTSLQLIYEALKKE